MKATPYDPDVTRYVLPLGVATVLLFAGCGDGDSDEMRVSEESVESFVARVGHTEADCATEDDDGIGKWTCTEPDSEDPIRLLVREGGSVRDAPPKDGPFVVGCCVEVDE